MQLQRSKARCNYRYGSYRRSHNDRVIEYETRGNIFSREKSNVAECFAPFCASWRDFMRLNERYNFYAKYLLSLFLNFSGKVALIARKMIFSNYLPTSGFPPLLPKSAAIVIEHSALPARRVIAG